MGRFVVRGLVVAHLRLQLGIELVQPLGVPRQRLHRHRAVDEDRQHRNPLLLFEPANPVEELLDPADREGRDHELAAALGGRPNHLRELLAVVVFFVNPVAVSRLHEQVVGMSRR